MNQRFEPAGCAGEPVTSRGLRAGRHTETGDRRVQGRAERTVRPPAVSRAPVARGQLAPCAVRRPGGADARAGPRPAARRDGCSRRDVVMVAVRLPAVAQQPEARRAVRLRDDGAAVAHGSEVLGRIETERAAGADACRPATPSLVARCAWQQSSTMASPWRAAIALIAVHGRRLAVQVHRDDRLVRLVTAASQAAGSSVSVSCSTSAITGAAPVDDHCQRRVRGGDRRHDDFVARHRRRAPAAPARSRRFRCRRRRRARAPQAAANSRSNASTSGPRTNQPLAITRWIASRTAAASSPGCRSRKGMRVRPAHGTAPSDGVDVVRRGARGKRRPSVASRRRAWSCGRQPSVSEMSVQSA